MSVNFKIITTVSSHVPLDDKVTSQPSAPALIEWVVSVELAGQPDGVYLWRIVNEFQFPAKKVMMDADLPASRLDSRKVFCVQRMNGSLSDELKAFSWPGQQIESIPLSASASSSPDLLA